MEPTEYAPPEGFSPISQEDTSIFDAQSIGNYDLCIMRLPKTINYKKLDGMTIDLSSNGSKSNAVGEFKIGDTVYELIQSIPTNLSDKQKDGNEEEARLDSGAQELQDISVLVPDEQEDGNLVFSPHQPNRFFTVKRKVTVIDPTDIAKQILSAPYVPREQPENMKFRFKPNGFDTGEPLLPRDGDDDDDDDTVKSPKAKKAKTSKIAEDSMSDKKTAEGASSATVTPKKSKKSKKSKSSKSKKE
ncbi:hypothetical protein H4219_005664 [Mycoemilia scoparia]|uniref:Uncharacterized protein n=1 Tax=Mycoemilia scoparia TaxID=417184 RepID=A0A9W7ZT14_9FUNG|nr:hypothetical protein H4219_005664 [Mycoemilia scoparia]